jgi:uncharacterized protein (DUF4415 family)
MKHMKKTLDEDDGPEITAELLKRARPAREALGDAYVDAHETRRLRRARGKQKAPTKQLISLRLSRPVVARYRASGPGWQARINTDLEKASRRLKRA